MWFVIAVPDLMADAATNLASIGSAMSAANAAVAAPTEVLLAAGADEVSAAIAAVFGAARPVLSGAERAGGGVS
jgi:PE family